jgi:hypothetical protein
MAVANLTGRWIGHYLQHGEECPITADLRETGEHLNGLMYDGRPDRECSLGQAVAEAGLPSGADEVIEAHLRGMVPDSTAGPIRYVTRLPPNSTLQGCRRGQTVYFLKSYQGTTFGGYQVGDHLVGVRRADHEVHYEGQLSPDGQAIEGRWWIEADTESGTPGTEGLFRLRRAEPAEAFAAQPAPLPGKKKEARPWWRFWS